MAKYDITIGGKSPESGEQPRKKIVIKDGKYVIDAPEDFNKRPDVVIGDNAVVSMDLTQEGKPGETQLENFTGAIGENAKVTGGGKVINKPGEIKIKSGQGIAIGDNAKSDSR